MQTTIAVSVVVIDHHHLESTWRATMHDRSTPSRPSMQLQQSQGLRNFLVTGCVLALGIAVGSAVSQDGLGHVTAGRLFLENPVPPVLAIPQGGCALVGASDDQYYIVTPDGRVEEIFIGNDEMRWR